VANDSAALIEPASAAPPMPVALVEKPAVAKRGKKKPIEDNGQASLF
jgi:hypothetical protein